MNERSKQKKKKTNEWKEAKDKYRSQRRNIQLCMELPSINRASTKNESRSKEKLNIWIPCRVMWFQHKILNAIAAPKKKSNCNQTECRLKSTYQEIEFQLKGHKSNRVTFGFISNRHEKLQMSKCYFRRLFNSFTNKQTKERTNENEIILQNVCLTTKLYDKKQ